MFFLRSAPGPEVFEYPVDGAMLATKAMGSRLGLGHVKGSKVCGLGP